MVPEAVQFEGTATPRRSQESDRPPPDRDDGAAADRRLAAELAREREAGSDPSNWEASCEAAFRERQFSRPCPACDGTGAKELTKSQARYYARKLERVGEEERENLRRDLRHDSTCQICQGTGFRPPPERRANVQRTWCEDCSGTGSRRDGGTCRRCRGLGSICLGVPRAGYFGARCVTAHCPRCRGSGEVPDEDVEDVCQLCRGEGFTVPITARPTGSSRHGFGPDVGAAPADPSSSAGKVLDPEEIGGDEGIVGAFERLSWQAPDLAAALRDYRGPIGNRWGHGHPWGRAFSLWPHTASGRQLIQGAAERLQAVLVARPVDLLALIRDEEELAKVPDIRRRALISRADREARQLLERARTALAEALRE